jgi:hypothetical protein
MEKLDYLVWAWPDPGSLRELLDLPGVRGLTVQLGDLDLPNPPILLGRGPDLGALVQVWMSSYDDRGSVEEVLRAVGPFDGYLVTESEPQPLTDRDWPDGEVSPGVSQVTWFPKPERLSEDEFVHGWHEVHTPHSAELHPLRWTYIRDAVVRTLTPGSPPIRAVVVERFRDLADYTDPQRLFGSPEALAATTEHLPNYADLSDLSSGPMNELVLRTPR